jgi:hypothetical protein
MTGDHHGQTAGSATLLVRAMDGILGMHNYGRRQASLPGFPPAADFPIRHAESAADLSRETTLNRSGVSRD